MIEFLVVYAVQKLLSYLFALFSCKLVIHCGVSRSDTQISVERQSFNTDYRSVDVEHCCPADECCRKSGPDTLCTSLNVDRLCERANKCCSLNGFITNAQPSTDPGRYLCAYIYYTSLSIDASRSLFVHVPSKDRFPVNEMSVALKEIILDALNQIFHKNF